MCEGEYESLKAIHAVSPGFVPKPYAWGRHIQEEPETYFLLAEFRDVGKQVRVLDSSIENENTRNSETTLLSINFNHSGRLSFLRNTRRWNIVFRVSLLCVVKLSFK